MRADRLAERALHGERRSHVITLGKAADALAAGAWRALGAGLQGGFIGQARGYAGEAPPAPVFERHLGGHPVPDAGSLASGRALARFARALPADARLAVLVSGGASACVELPAPGVGLELLRRANGWLLASGLPIAAMNRVRAGLSGLKSGGLARLLGARKVAAWVLCDVPDGRLEAVGGGPLGFLDEPLPPVPDWLRPRSRRPLPPVPSVPLLRLAGNEELVAAVVRAGARPAGRLDGEARALGLRIGRRLKAGPPGLAVWGGEPRVRLPGHPGRGGRCQLLALAAAVELEGEANGWLLAAASDGWDGTDPVAGACIDGSTLARGRAAGLDPEACLERADAGRFLAGSGDQVRTGVTGTNVNDLVITLKIARQ